MSERAHPIMALWCHPRSMSTAVERVMRERGDLVCFHEPFLPYHYGKPEARHLRHAMLEADRPPSFSDVCASIAEAARSAPVFLKDMAYYVLPELLNAPEFAGRLRHAFLIREPRRAILSYHRLDPDVTSEEIGLTAAWDLAQGLERLTGRPVVLEAEAVQRDPRAEMRRLWSAWDLADRPDAVEWQADAPPGDWHHVAGWHESAIASGGIRPPEPKPGADVDFDSAAAAEPRLAALLAEHLPAYRCLKAWAPRMGAVQ